jgi:hypothetical protein
MNPDISTGPRQAVVIIHGIGEQEPMETLRSFAESIIPDIKQEDNTQGVKQKFYVKPDEMSELFDLRRITVPGVTSPKKEKADPSATDTKEEKTGTPVAEGNRDKTDFYEYYWAHQMRDTQLGDVTGWIANIFLRWKFVPKRLSLLHHSLVLLLLLVPLTLVAGWIYCPWIKQHLGQVAALAAAGAGTFYLIFKYIGRVVNSVSLNYIGDAARYLTPKPGNIINRQQIRQDGLDLLRKLHGEREPGSNAPKYTRIVVVAHSLGSVIAYDLLTALWGSYHAQFSSFNQQHQNKLKAMQERVNTMSQKATLTAEELKDFQTLQSELLAASQDAGSPWLVSDFVTIGCPLSHAQLLLAKGKESLQQMQKDRLFPACPPVMELQKTISYDEKFHFAPDVETKMKVPHHAALFALTRWTNCWFKNDFVGGPMQQSLGKGIKDIELVSKTHCRLPFLSHTFYWDKRETESVQIIRDIIFKPVVP